MLTTLQRSLAGTLDNSGLGGKLSRDDVRRRRLELLDERYSRPPFLAVAGTVGVGQRQQLERQARPVVFDLAALDV